MKILLAPDSFKGSASSLEIARWMEQGVRRVVPDAEVVKLPVADGGEGTVEAFCEAAGGQLLPVPVTGPLGKRVTARCAILPDGTGVIEMAQASGLTLVEKDRRDPMVTTTRGTGELMQFLLDKGCRNFLLGIGGSATNDGGAGMAQALGVRLLDADGKELGPGGGELARLVRIDRSGMDVRWKQCRVLVASDVTNPLCGPQGASAVYGPQKGATPEMVRILDANLANLARVVRQECGLEIASVPGAGAAGGLGAGLLAFCQAEIRPGVDTVLDAVHLEAHLAGADLVLTGEGAMDAQSLFGKCPVGVARRCKAFGAIPVVALVGGMGPGIGGVHGVGIDAVFSLVNRPMSLGEAIAEVQNLTIDATEQILRLFLIGKNRGQV